MDEGFIADLGHGNFVNVGMWVEGVRRRHPLEVRKQICGTDFRYRLSDADNAGGLDFRSKKTINAVMSRAVYSRRSTDGYCGKNSLDLTN